MPPVPVTIPACLNTSVCANCGYSLLGLSEPIVCPECGRSHDPTQLLLHGFARGQHEHVGNARPWRIVWLSLGSLAYVAVQLPQLAYGPFGFQRIFFYAIVVMTIVPMIHALFRRAGGAHPGLVQARMNAQSCVQYDDLGGPSPIRDFYRAQMWLIPILVMAGLIIGWRLGQIGTVWFWIWLSVCALFAWPGWKLSREFRRGQQQVRVGAVAEANAPYYKPTPWKKIRGFTLTQSKPGDYRLCINNTGRFGGEVVNLEITLTDEQANALERLLTEWKSQSQ